MRNFRSVAIALLAVAGSACAAEPARLGTLRVMGDQWPRAFFFRAAEGMASNRRITYDQWEHTFSRLMGIEGKCLDEEIPGRSARNIPFFTRFKRQHPDQLVLLHYNGNSRDPRDATPDFFAGHWLYHSGCTILADVPAEEGEADIRVADPSLFRVNIGRYRKHNEDIGLCLLDKDGRPNWHESEQVQLLAVDLRRKTIRVRRGCYGTRPRAFPAGRAYAAAHAHEGPWGRRSNLLWFYNYSTRSPRDKRGRSCADVLAADLARHFGPSGDLAAFDGIEFDVLHNTCGRRSARRAPDCDADGKPDGGWLDGVNTYGIGVVEFCRKLRAALGDDRLILADGASRHNQRAFGILNGIESEGWPHLSDWQVRDWSGGLNRHLYWHAFGRQPAFSYVNHKFVTRGDAPGKMKRPHVPWNIHRLVLAASVFTDSAVCYSFAPPREEGERLGIWDELRKGAEHEPGWLGKPLGPAIRLAERQPDLLQGSGSPFRAELLRRFRGDGVRFSIEKGALKVEAADPKSTQLRFRLIGVPCDGPDLAVSLTARGQPLRGYPREMPRLTWVGIPAPEACLTRPEPPAAGMRLRGGKETRLDRATGASLRWFHKVALGKDGVRRSGYFVHPPYKTGTGYTFWTRDVTVPRDGRLEFYTGMGQKSPEKSDGVVFWVYVAELIAGQPGPFALLSQTVQKAWRWSRQESSLARWAGKRVRLKFVADAGPKDNSTTDHAHWADVWVLGPKGRGAVTEAARFMTWTGDRDFTSGFTFNAVKSPAVDLEFELDGGEPVWITRLTAHAHADAMVREFERGAILANPSPRPYAFDLAKLFPGKTFRRLRGSSRQDPKTNDGRPVTGPLTLGPQDALFLARTR